MLRDDLMELHAYHDAKRAELWPSQQAEAMRHARLADAALCAANNAHLTVTPAEFARLHPTG